MLNTKSLLSIIFYKHFKMKIFYFKDRKFVILNRSVHRQPYTDNRVALTKILAHWSN